jgi:hypothetical protein
MARRVLPLFVTSFALASLAGCGFVERAERPAWRGQAENACLANKGAQVSAYVRAASAISGPGICGAEHPFKISAIAGGTVGLNTDATLACPMLPALDEWIAETVQPAAMARFGQPVTMVQTMGSYGCRSINHKAGAQLSEHAFGNALDIGGFRLADGREINVQHGWKGDPADSAFLHDVQAGACTVFTTVLAPGSDAHHYNHIHADLAQHGSGSRGRRRICKPVPQPPVAPAPRIDTLPDPPPIEEEIDIAATQGGSLALHARAPGGGPGLVMRPDGVLDAAD